MKPVLLVVAGPNGAGKTTVTARLRVERWSEGTEYLKPDEVAARVAGRVMEGGHTVPIEKIVSRYVRSMANLSSVMSLADRVYVYDNSVDGVEARLCFRTQDGLLRKVHGELPDWVADAARGLERHPQFVDMRAA